MAHWVHCHTYLVLQICGYGIMQSQKAVSAYFTSKQILPFDFAEQYSGVVVTSPRRRLTQENQPFST